MNGKHMSNNDELSDVNSSSINWMEKLKPSSRNKAIQKRYQNLSKGDDYNSEREKLTKYGIDVVSLSNIDKSFSIHDQSERNNQNIVQKWNRCVAQSKIKNLCIHSESMQIEKIEHNELDYSILCFEEIGNMIEEKYQIAYSENMFLKQHDNHSIIPFLLIKSKEVHRMCLSDYEIKHTYKLYKSKSKSFKADSFDYYRIGLINFYKGKYILAYNSFKNAIKNKDNDINLKKWFSFVGIILLFCDDNKIDFSYIKKKKYDENLEKEEMNKEKDGFSLFQCCSSRKENKENVNNKIKKVQMEILNNNDNLTTSDKDTSYSSIVNSINKQSLAKEILEHLSSVVDKNSTNSNQLEGWWIYLLISTFCSINPKQKLFTSKINEPKYFVKKIKEIDDYLSYIAYAEYNYLLNDDFQIDVLLRQLMSRYPSKIEAYLRFWQLIMKGKFQNLELANSISEAYWKNSSTLQFDDGIFNLYILITHAKAKYQIGQHFYSITYYQKEYPSNFLFPSLYYLFGKYSSKSNSKSLKQISVSSLKEVYNLLYEDLQFSVFYWLGNIYYNTGNYYDCFKVWKKYIENADKSFDVSYKKVERIKIFLKKFEVVWNSIEDFNKNLKLTKRMKLNISANSKNNVVNTTAASNTTNQASSKLNNYLKTIQSIKEIEVDLKFNKSIIYDYYKAVCYFTIDKNIPESLKILMNISNSKRHYMPALFTTWKIISHLKEYKLLLNFSFYMIKVSHMSEVSSSDWIKSYVLYSKALQLNNKHEEAIILLINTLDVFAHLPLEEAKYLNSVYYQNKISTTNFFVNFDKALQFYSRYHIYKKSMGIFNFNFNFKKSKKCDKFILNVKDLNEDGTLKKDISITSNNGIINNSFSCTTTSDLEIDSVKKLEEYIDTQIESIDIPFESPFLTIISGPDIFLKIGKACAKSETKRELGLMCLEDYIHLLKFSHNYKLNEKKETKKQKAYFWMCILNIQLRQYNQAKQCVDKIDKLYEIDTARKKSKIVKMFMDFYKQHVCLNDSISYDFEISKEDLKQI